MNLAVGPERIGQTDSIGTAPTINEDHDVCTQMTLVIEHVAAQPRVVVECHIERTTQGGRGRVDFGCFGEAPQLRSEDDACHAAIMLRRYVRSPDRLARVSGGIAICAG